ncbi:MAG: hypothetical protein IPI54_01145 [Chitinophagaceae bacterium]|nr:hypothetical protein [Chitinophagaceae bacterium]
MGVGFTVMVNVSGIPGQPDADGVTVIDAVTCVLPVLIAVKEGIFPLPFAASPIDGLLFTQLYDVLPIAPVNVMALVAAPLHKIWFAG